MATYVNDLRLKEIGTGESSGTWGTETNTNLELIAEAFSFGTEAITTNADTHTTTIADGSTDPGRSMYLKYTGTLDSACTITIGPNTVSKMWFIENGTSGSQNIIISQGSGANITIPPGDVKVVYSDGAGSGAAVVDAFASLSVVDLKVQDDLTVTDDLIVNGDIDLEGSIDVNGTANLDVVDIDGAVDMASTLQVDGAITSSAGATITTADNSTNLTLTSTDADANSGPILELYRNSSSPADDDVLGEIEFHGENDADEKIQYGLIAAKIQDASDGTEDVRLSFKTIVAGTERERITLQPSETVFNEDSVDLDFRVESDNLTHALFVQGSDGNVGIGGASAPAFENGNGLEIRNSSGNGAHLKLTDNASGTGATQGFDLYMFNSQAYIENYENAPTIFRNNGGERMRISSSGQVSIGTTSTTAPLRVKVATDANFAVQNTSSTVQLQGINDAANAFATIDIAGNPIKFSANGSESMRIDSSGNVGIGCTPDAWSGYSVLQIGTAGCLAASEDITFVGANAYSSASGWKYVTTDEASLYQQESSSHIWYGASSGSADAAISWAERMRITSNGSVFIGTTSEADGSTGGVSFSPDSSARRNLICATTGTGTLELIEFRNPNGTVGKITTSGSATAYNTSSDARLKDITGSARGLEVINELNPVSYNWKADGKADEGLIAQEVLDIVPNAVSGSEEDMYQMDYSKLVVHLVAGMKEQQAQIEALQSEINLLKGE